MNLADIFYDPKRNSSFSSASKLSKTSGVPLSEVKAWLSTQRAYTIHAPRKTKFKRRKVIVGGGIFETLEMDLIDMSRFAQANSGTRYLLCVIDAFTRRAFVRNQTSKSGPTTMKALSSILERIASLGGTPYAIGCDSGSEFFNRSVTALMKRKGIRLFSSYNKDIKSSLIERFNRSIQTRIYKFMTHWHTDAYVPVLQHFVDSYNNSHHRTLGMAPVDVTPANSERVWMKIYWHRDHALKRPKFETGDYVRVSKIKNIFAKGYLPSYTERIYVIVTRHETVPWTYSLREHDSDDVIVGKFYEQEMIKASLPDEYVIENILRYRKRKGIKEALVRWLGYTDPTWEPVSALKT